jgi:hypothetical protein
LTSARRRLRRVLLFAATGAVLLAALRVALFRPLGLSGAAPDDGYVRVPAVVHVHTTLSDGGGTPDEVIGAAREAGVAVLGITDHNNLDAKRFEGYRDGVLVLVGSELSTPAGHVLGIGLDRDPAFRFAGDTLDALDDVRYLGGVPFAAHPFSPREDLRFRDLQLPGDWGLELLNGDSEARRAGPRLLLTAATYRLNPSYALLAAMQPIDEALGRWDALLARRDAAGIAGSDAHSRLALTESAALRFPSYEALFRQARNHLLLRAPLRGDAASDRAAVLGALRSGRFYLGLDALAPADGFAFTVEDGSGRRFTMGEHLEPVGSLVARAGGRVPESARIVLKRDGAVVAESPRSLELALPGAGVYRVEAWLPGRPVPWIVTNPVYVFDAATLEARRKRAEWPTPPAPTEVQPLGFTSEPPFSAEHDPGSKVDPSVLAPRRGPEGADAFRLAFELAGPDAGKGFTWCALVNRENRDLSGWTGLRLSVKGDTDYRFWVQLRDPNPASDDAGLEWWMVSVRASSEWSEVLVPFSRFRTLNPKSDGRLSLGSIRELVVMIDPATVKPGTAGQIRLSEVGVYR